MKVPCKGITNSGKPCNAPAFRAGFCVHHQDQVGPVIKISDEESSRLFRKKNIEAISLAMVIMIIFYLIGSYRNAPLSNQWEQECWETYQKNLEFENPEGHIKGAYEDCKERNPYNDSLSNSIWLGLWTYCGVIYIIPYLKMFDIPMR